MTGLCATCFKEVTINLLQYNLSESPNILLRHWKIFEGRVVKGVRAAPGGHSPHAATKLFDAGESSELG